MRGGKLLTPWAKLRTNSELLARYVCSFRTLPMAHMRRRRAEPKYSVASKRERSLLCEHMSASFWGLWRPCRDKPFWFAKQKSETNKARIGERIWQRFVKLILRRQIFFLQSLNLYLFGTKRENFRAKSLHFLSRKRAVTPEEITRKKYFASNLQNVKRYQRGSFYRSSKGQVKIIGFLWRPKRSSKKLCVFAMT